MNPPKVLVVGANPAWQKTLFFDRLGKGEVNRAEKMDSYSSGKGVNFSRAAACRGQMKTHLFQFTGGDNGRFLERGLDAEKIVYTSIRTEGETRCCVTCLSVSENEMTELIEPSLPVSDGNLRDMYDLVCSELPKADALAICGTMPSGTRAGLYPALANLVRDAGKILLFDSVAEAEKVLSSGARILLKINEKELKIIFGGNTIRESLKRLLTAHPLVTAAITAGPDKAYFLDKDRITEYIPARLETVVSPIGSGDTASAVLLGEILSGTPGTEAFASALAAASANCLTQRGGNFREEERRLLLKRILFETNRL